MIKVDEAKLVGRIFPAAQLVGTLTQAVGTEDYTGNYEVTPKTTKQSLQTKGKRMTDDVTVKSIPFFDVSNTSGGSTVYIGNEV